jgi:hypothetical protein
MVLGAARSWLLAAAVLPATWRGWDPHRPAEAGSHVCLRHDAYLFRHMLLMRAAARTEPVGQPRRQLHISTLQQLGTATHARYGCPGQASGHALGWATPVRPAAKLSLEPADFPLLASIRGHETHMRVTR